MGGWWDELFGAAGWQFVQRRWSDVEDTADQAERVIEVLALGDADAVLDVPSGDGRIALALGAAGYEVHGIDLVPAFVDAARAEAARRGLDRVTFEVGDLREPVRRDGFEAAICVWGSFGYFDDAGNLAQARAAAGALRPGGRYLIDTPTLETVLPRFRERHWFTVGDVHVLEERAFALGTSRIETAWTFVRGDGPPETRRSSVRVYSVHELTELLRAAGFGTFTLLDDGLAPFELGAERLWIVATTGEAG